MRIGGAASESGRKDPQGYFAVRVGTYYFTFPYSKAASSARTAWEQVRRKVRELGGTGNGGLQVVVYNPPAAQGPWVLDALEVGVPVGGYVEGEEGEEDGC